jgi:hypothetical protein
MDRLKSVHNGNQGEKTKVCPTINDNNLRIAKPGLETSDYRRCYVRLRNLYQFIRGAVRYFGDY